ncbi:MAG: DeoR family transcriptional regulator, partial [Epulopiscium sp.]|nr:DeoR family transcriptional regulator [Candidatus Epulonipiscium sp.]
MNLTKRQQQIIDIVKKQGPITANQIAKQLGYSKSTLRSDFNLLT